MLVAKGYRPVDRDQQFLLPVDMREWLPVSDPVFTVIEVVAALDTSAVHAVRRTGGVGRAVYDPDMLLTVLIFGWDQGQRSSRVLERFCQRDAAFRIICAGNTPDHVTISRFRADVAPHMDALFTQVLLLCGQLGLARLGVVALDGVKISSDASLSANRTEKGLRAAAAEAAEQRLREHARAAAAEHAAADAREDELGDLLFQAVYHAQMASEAGHFTLDDVVRAISDKMITRHPHVFGDTQINSADAQTQAWEVMKARERAARAQTGVLDDVPLALPALMRALKLQNRAARVGFDWPEIGQVVDKIAEEARELAEARESLSPGEIAEEYGDLLFVMANLGRHLKIDPETALRAANDKFTRRFRSVEAALLAQGRSPSESTLEEMDALWDAAKAAEKSSGPARA